MLLIQHIWARWTKRSRGADTPLHRPRLADAYALPSFAGPGEVLWHEIRAIEGDEDFLMGEEKGAITCEAWRKLQPPRENALDWRRSEEEYEIVVKRPSERLQTKWPAVLPNPLFRLSRGESARIEWNGRFATSMSGRNRATYYEQHVYWLAFAERPSADLFLNAKPKKWIDLRAEIY